MDHFCIQYEIFLVTLFKRILEIFYRKSGGIFQLRRRTAYDVSVENNRSRETSTHVSSCRGRKETQYSQFFSSRKRDCHRRSNLSSTRMTDRSTRQDKIFGSNEERHCCGEIEGLHVSIVSGEGRRSIVLRFLFEFLYEIFYPM